MGNSAEKELRGESGKGEILRDLMGIFFPEHAKPFPLGIKTNQGLSL